MKTSTPTKDKILDVAQALLQTRGYHGFSYADISTEVAIRKASIHHHFPSKIALTIEVIRRYREMFNNSLAHILSTKKSLPDQIQAYTHLYKQTLEKDKLCLCGMLAADIETLPLEVKTEVQAFMTDNIVWLTQVLLDHDKNYSKKQAEKIAYQMLNTLQGAMLIARLFENPELFAQTSKTILINFINH